MKAKETFLRMAERVTPPGEENKVAYLQMSTGIARSILNKYLSTESQSRVDQVPQSAVSLIKLMALVRVRNPELFTEWCILMQCNSDIFDTALQDSTVYQKIEKLGLLKTPRDKILGE